MCEGNMREIWHRSLASWKGLVKDQTEIVEFTGLELEDEGGFPVNTPEYKVKLDQSVNHTWKNLKGGLNAKFQKRKPSRRTNGGFVNDVLSSWEEMKIENIRNAIDARRALVRFSVPTRHVKRERVISLSLESDSVFQINSKPSHFMILRIVQIGHVNCPFFEIGHFVLCLRVCVT